MSRYARMYWTVMDDAKFDGIREDVRLFGSWAMCLLVADMAWPAPAFVPPMVPRASFRRLVECGLVDELPGSRYRIHGMDPEREKRSALASDAASHRWSKAERNANGNAIRNAETVLPEQSRVRAEQSSTRAGLPSLTDDVASAWEQATGRSVLASGQFAADVIDDATHRHGGPAVTAAILRTRQTFPHIPSTQALAVAVRNTLDPLPDGKQLAAAEREEEQATASRRRVQETLRRTHYAHTEPVFGCPLCQEAAA